MADDADSNFAHNEYDDDKPYDDNHDAFREEDGQSYREEDNAPNENAFEHMSDPIIPEDDDEDPTIEDAATGDNTATTSAEENPGKQHCGYTLLNRLNTNSNNSFQTAMDKPFNCKSCFPPTHQLLDKDNFGYIMTQMATNTEFAKTMTQMSANAGLRKLEQKAEEAILAKFAQLKDLNVYEPLDPNKLTHVHKKQALRAINLIKEERSGKLKGLTVADGRSQKSLFDK